MHTLYMDANIQRVYIPEVDLEIFRGGFNWVEIPAQPELKTENKSLPVC